jgi:hypothetical protein
MPSTSSGAGRKIAANTSIVEANSDENVRARDAIPGLYFQGFPFIVGKLAREVKYAFNRNHKDRSAEISHELAAEEIKRK